MGGQDAILHIDFSKGPFERVQTLFKDLLNSDDDEDFATEPLRKNVRLISASAVEGTQKAQAIFELDVTKSLCNKAGNLHGGAACTLLDILTSMPLNIIATPGHLDAGNVSRTITMSYLRPVPAGTTVRVECDIVAAGRNTANLQGTIKTLDGKVCVTCVHDKVAFSTKPKSKL
ncbi:MAG: hypothetical protein Q9160_008085 [Pyrenula sp. 1 TL-2023]